MRQKTADLFYAFCVSVGGMCIALLYPVDLITLAILFVLTVAFVWLCSKINIAATSRAAAFLAVGSLVSSSVAVYTGVSLSSVFALDKTFVPMLVFICCGTAIALSFSNARAAKSLAFVMSLIGIVLLLVVFLLCILESDFTKDISVSTDKKILFPLTVFTVADCVYVMPLIARSNRRAYIFGSVMMPIYVMASALLAVSSLSSKIYMSVDSPIIKMWQTCYVLSFVDRFETLIICVLFAICTVKAGIMLKIALDNSTKKLVPVFVALSGLLILQPLFLYAYAVLGVLFAVLYIINLYLKKSVDL